MRGRTILVLLAAALGSLLLASPAIAGPETPISGLAVPSPLLGSLADDLLATADLSTLLDPTGHATQHYGPYPSGSPDSGTCGVDWATDTFDRHFTVKTNQRGGVVWPTLCAPPRRRFKPAEAVAGLPGCLVRSSSAWPPPRSRF